LRELQIRITGSCNETCSDCGKICSCYKGGGKLSEKLFTALFEQIKGVTIEHVLITGGNPTARFDALVNIKKNISASKFSILFQGNLNSEVNEQLNKLGIECVAPIDRQAEIFEENIKVDPFAFFYNQSFNACWGNKIAIDWDGAVRPCLWSEDILGNISNSNIRDMIVSGDFDKYWELTKDNTDTCKDCEYRYACADCRVLALKKTGLLSAKHPSCRYDPFS
jgi:radical SAM protein with 4Fe4S-binding SPASM domain